jgi:hypothetical protein
MLFYALDPGLDPGLKAAAGATFPKTVLWLRTFPFFALAAHR